MLRYLGILSTSPLSARGCGAKIQTASQKRPTGLDTDTVTYLLLRALGFLLLALILIWDVLKRREPGLPLGAGTYLIAQEWFH